jgi:hypothetical protein
MVKYGDGKAGQWAKSKAQRSHYRILLRLIFGGMGAGTCLGIGIGGWAFQLLAAHYPHASPNILAIFSIGALAMALVFMWLGLVFCKRLTARIDKLAIERVKFLHGGQAEALVAYSLQDLDEHWHLFNNIAMKGGGDIDHVLIGPGGSHGVH